MNYIVFDLEWNQNPSGKKTRNDRLPFEIIEIGAVKVNSKKEITSTAPASIKISFTAIWCSLPQLQGRAKSSASTRI